MKKVLLASSLCCLFSPAILATPHWEYQGEAGPEQWAKLTPEFDQCAGSNQSPVDLEGMVDAKLAPLVIHYKVGGKTVVNNGHTVQVGYVPGSTLQVDGMSFELKQFHFHAPSENLIEGKSYPLEGHLVHVNDKGEIAVVAVMFKAGKSNAALAEALSALPAKVGEIQPLSAPLSAEQLLPKRRDYYRFNGSLTTPPCSEGVRWLVMKQPVEVSQTQIDAFKAVMHNPNNRPVQSLNGRVILQ
ncbi:carbonic anhydrase [Pseudomonas sp. LAMO17WK12:I10]|uniref:carbonic anhydrase n=1 Tax=unclassified Pseudomonas TaxID=196821 RepID=UPI000BC86770|nr:MULTISPECIES: carbonic anhydrase [unclassified Pseudomonas]PXX50348.1 carbonic anhydrase [Pseudomonas sp. LAMO17WK12:I9]SNY54184.1 carbonic anhydrase [Pseudomonas sp. LAMO17WK12:I10]